MRKTCVSILVFIFLALAASSAHAQAGVYLGLLAGSSSQKPNLTGVEFDTNTSYCYGVKAGVRFLMLGLEASYFQATHNLKLRNFLFLDWKGRQVDYNFIGLNVKYILSLLMIHPYLTFGYGFYTADIHDIDKDKDKGYNLGAGVEVPLGKKISVSAEGKYHRVKLDIREKEFRLGNLTLTGGLNIYF